MKCSHSIKPHLVLLIATAAAAAVAAAAATLAQGQSGTRVGFYSSSCPEAESIVKSTVESHFKTTPRVAPSLLRMHFHDCFVRGCDASILIDGPNAEKTTVFDSGLIVYNVIDDAKTRLEAACPGVVSCADIIALAARDSVVLTNGPNWEVPTGRRDGRVSLASEVDANLVGVNDSVDVQKQKFASVGLNTQDLVALVGGHTIGSTACRFFSDRLYNFTGNGPDPSIDPSLVPKLQSLCPRDGDGNSTSRVDLDTESATKFDTSFFANLRIGRGVLLSDQALWTDPSTRVFAQRFLGLKGFEALHFNEEFVRSMVKMSNIGVKTGTRGEIRKVCYAIN